MRTIKFNIFPPPPILEREVECFSLVEYSGDEALAIKVAPKAVPGLVFQHNEGHSALESILTPSGSLSPAPGLFVYKAGITPSVMHFTKGSYTTLQVIFKPHALNSLFGLDASSPSLSRGFMALEEFSGGALNEQLLEVKDRQEQIALLTTFLITQLKQERRRDRLVEESLKLIDQNVGWISVKYLIEHLNISQRQFERRFHQTIGITPQAYLRVKRFNEAVRLIKSGQYQKLTEVAYTLNFYDQAHLIRDIQTFSRLTPKTVCQKEKEDAGFYQEQVGYSYL